MIEEALVIHKTFSDIASRFPDRIALQMERNNQWLKVAYKDLQASSQKIAAFLMREGFRRGDCAAIILDNCPEWAIIYLGIMYAGLTCVPLDPQSNPQDLETFIIDSTAKVLFCSYNIFSERITQKLKDHLTKVVLLDANGSIDINCVKFLDIESITPDTSSLPDVSCEDIASLIYTSGTTAKPKGVLLSHKNICSNFKSIEKLNICFTSDNMLSILPLYHTYAFMVTLIVPLFLGAQVTYFALDFRPQELVGVMQEAKVTVLVGVPQIFSLLHKGILNRIKNIPGSLRFFILPLMQRKVRSQIGASLRLFVSGGARLEAKTGRDLSRFLGINLIEGYGLTETSPVVTLNPPRKIKFGSVGRPIPDVQIKILNPDKSGVGQVLIKGPNVMQGYFKQPDLTSQVIKDGWFYSGDLGYLDKQGYLFITGREKDVIVLSSGKNIYPDELQEYYSQSSYIKEICILEKQEEKFGYRKESLFAVIVANLEYFHQRNESDIRGKIRWDLENLGKGLPAYKHIMGFTVIKEALPRTALRKIKRYEVRQKYLQEELQEVESKALSLDADSLKILNNDIAKKIINYISQELHRPVYLDNHLEIDLGVDSLGRVELGLGLEAFLGIKIPEDLIYSVSTVRDLIANIIDKNTGIANAIPAMQKDWYQILREPLKETMLGKIRVEIGFLDRLLAWILKAALLFIFRVFWRLRIKGKEYLPKQGPYLICPNHASYLDGFVVFSSLGIKNAMDVFFLGYSEILEQPLISWATKAARLISIDANTHLTEAMQAASFVLAQDKIVCIFPEGRRSIDENMGEFKKGVGILIKELDVPVVPVYIKGSHKSWPRVSRLPRFCPLKITFGLPKAKEELLGKAGKGSGLDDYETIANVLKEEVRKLAC